MGNAKRAASKSTPQTKQSRMKKKFTRELKQERRRAGRAGGKARAARMTRKERVASATRASKAAAKARSEKAKP
jgi:hypothetical protein